ncbi:MAG TPA: histidine--tRNA ligase [Candidatus Limnocylindrales bacterium]|nr:histidine--tRNA ligase [Candidatus Limnocylindrales bacterium]
MPKFQAPRGTRDLLPADATTYRRMSDIASRLSELYGYRPIETPMFEDSAVFERGIGEVTDIVEKELFRIRSPGSNEDRWALRPEATAGICRAFVEHGMHTLPQPVRLATFGPMFRYDRPQAGRYRQFYQWNVEAIGDAGPAIDAELIELALRFVRDVGVQDVELHLNSIGDAACRPAYIAALVEYLAKYEDALPPTERHRLRANPLRVLDTRDARTQAILDDAPTIDAFLCPACRDHFDSLLAHLDRLEVPIHRAPRLVRGLDYYTRTAFELYQRGAEGQQSALGGGGRYDGLIELFGARPTPGVGFALGIDRIAMLAAKQGVAESIGKPVAVVVGADPAATDVRLALATQLRAAGVATGADLAPRKLGRQLEGAAREGAHFAIVIGDELEAGQVQLRDLEAGTQRLVNVADLVRELQRAHASHRHGESDTSPTAT